MIYLKWLILALLDWVLLLTVPVAAAIIAAFTRARPYDQQPYTWGWIWGTWDNPPQGDEGFVEKRSPFPGVITGLRGYVNRVAWMIRNPMYGYARLASIKWRPELQLSYAGDPTISDKYRRPGWYLAKLRLGGKLVGFEFYCVLPWSSSRDLRMRLGWKLMTDKFKRHGFAQLVNSCNPFDGYGNK